MMSTTPVATAPDFADIVTAANRLSGHVHRTAVYASRSFNDMVGAEVFFKCENLQRAGSFKVRGAMNAVFSLDEPTARRGIITHSSGNHAAAVALAARERGVPAHIVVSNNAPRAKIESVRRYGGQLTLSEPTLAAREEAARRLLDSTGGTFIHPFDDARVIAGQGTATFELLDQVADIDVVLAPVSGGGLLSGTAIAAHGVSSAITVYGCEPALADDAARSFATGTLEKNVSQATIADGLRASLSERTFGILRQHVNGIVTVSEDEIIHAMRLFWELFKLIIEPSCAVPVAALLAGRVDVAGRRVGVIITGGNVDLDALPWQKPLSTH
jgi:threonine dehydratase